ncbi:MAG: 3-deoxy-7-phosphoheptulonate synthase class II [Gammaproteobacteria bacterium]|nr:3-deoxy-7-phosphoheptulonate synthase class II [Gammaproteobacteria bacterium]
MTATADSWSPESWQQRPALQQPNYPDAARLQSALDRLAALPPIVTSWEIEDLKKRLAAAQAGRGFVLQGGDCAESFTECTSPRIVGQLKILLQMSVVMTAGMKRPVTRIGRMAGQYAKPRSADLEERGDDSLPSYRGDLVNRQPFTSADREPDPELLLRGYERAALTLNFVRGLIDGGFADLHHPENWDLDFVSHSSSADKYHSIVQKVRDGLDFFESISERPIHEARRVDFFAAHEGLHLHYEQAQTRHLEHRHGWYNLTTHFPWIGLRTAHPEGAHVEFFRGIENPIGVKVGEALDKDHLQELVRRLNPDNEPGRLALIHRLGAERVAEALPQMIEAVRETGIDVLWICDPMHGNTESTSSGFKTRRFENIASELDTAFRVHRDHGSRLGGVHLELTGEHVTECTGGPRGLTEHDLTRDYRSTVDPRLNYDQAMEIALQIAGQP